MAVAGQPQSQGNIRAEKSCPVQAVRKSWPCHKKPTNWGKLSRKRSLSRWQNPKPDAQVFTSRDECLSHLSGAASAPWFLGVSPLWKYRGADAAPLGNLSPLVAWGIEGFAECPSLARQASRSHLRSATRPTDKSQPERRSPRPCQGSRLREEHLRGRWLSPLCSARPSRSTIRCGPSPVRPSGTRAFP